MKVIAWNLAHQVKARPIPDCLVSVILDLEAEIVLLNLAWRNFFGFGFHVPGRWCCRVSRNWAAC